MAKSRRVELEVAGRTVSVSSPDRVVFPKTGHTKIDVVRYYLAVAEGAHRHVRDRPMVLKRFVDGAEGEPFFQKRAPRGRPDWVETATLRFPSGRTAEEVVARSPAEVVWAAQMGCIDLNPHPVRADDLEHPDELRIDLDPVPGVPWSQIRDVAFVCRESLQELGLDGWPKTSGSRGIHIYVRIAPRWGFDEVRRAALAIARDVEARAPTLATSRWWKEERHGVFLDYNQNAKDRTVASAYSIRPTPDARVSAPVTWEELRDADPADFTIATMPERFARLGDVAAGIDDRSFDLDPVLELSARHEADGQGDAPWPPHYQKQAGEPKRVQPSRNRRRRSSRGSPASPAASPRASSEDGVTAVPEAAEVRPTGRRRSKMPLVVVARAKQKSEALAGLERWKARHPKAAAHLEPADVLVDAGRGRHTSWTQVRVNLRHVPVAERPPQEPPDPDYDPAVEWGGAEG
ncbi:MAG TPA: non-homologous end-joining DNA ligase [Polyangiaceae bacterium LLY-WYZ-14_1]|nr:non-homologous end-joining DNA ligase [Polyangiaceae bacterium LLY-WYZ-14_1]